MKNSIEVGLLAVTSGEKKIESDCIASLNQNLNQVI